MRSASEIQRELVASARGEFKDFAELLWEDGLHELEMVVADWRLSRTENFRNPHPAADELVRALSDKLDMMFVFVATPRSEYIPVLPFPSQYLSKARIQVVKPSTGMQPDVVSICRCIGLEAKREGNIDPAFRANVQVVQKNLGFGWERNSIEWGRMDVGVLETNARQFRGYLQQIQEAIASL